MDRDGAAARAEPSEGTPSLSQIASTVGVTRQHEPDDLYISYHDQLNPHPHPNIDYTPYSTSSSLSSPTIGTSIVFPNEQQPPIPWRSNAFEIVANGAMSRQTAQGGSKQPAPYQLKSSDSPADQARSLSQNNKDQLINSLRTHKVNTITELRRVEKIFAYLDSEEVTEPMTAAWAHYVNSNNLLNELRGLTKKIPFSSECLDEAKALVVSDPASVRSWNYCWLVLIKIEKENLIVKYARALASKRSTWGDKQPSGDQARKFITACVAEWTQALQQMLKHWDKAPSTTGN